MAANWYLAYSSHKQEHVQMFREERYVESLSDIGSIDAEK